MANTNELKSFSSKVNFLGSEVADIGINVKGYSVTGGGTYTGDLLCTGLTHWRVADLTSRFIGNRSQLFKDKCVLELGCGLGLCGIVAAHAVGREGSVLLTDRDNECLTIAAENIIANNAKADVTLLSWDDHVKATQILADISNKYNKQGFDVIVGSDCLYSGTEAIKNLLSVVAYLLAGNNRERFKDNPDILFCSDNSKIDIEKTVEIFSFPDKDALSDINIDYLIPTSMDGGGWMVPIDSVQTPNNCRSHRPVFILGYERRLGGADVDMSAMFKIAYDLGLEWCIAEDSLIDIFGNETDEQTMFWEQCVFLFTRRI